MMGRPMLVSVALFVAGLAVGYAGAVVHVVVGSALVATGALAYFLRDLSLGIVEALGVIALLASFQAGFLLGACLGARRRP